MGAARPPWPPGDGVGRLQVRLPFLMPSPLRRGEESPLSAMVVSRGPRRLRRRRLRPPRRVRMRGRWRRPAWTVRLRRCGRDHTPSSTRDRSCFSRSDIVLIHRQAGSVLAVLRRIRISSGGDGVLAADPSIAALGDPLAATLTAQNLCCPPISVGLSALVSAGPFGIRRLDVHPPSGLGETIRRLGFLLATARSV